MNIGYDVDVYVYMQNVTTVSSNHSNQYLRNLLILVTQYTLKVFQKHFESESIILKLFHSLSSGNKLQNLLPIFSCR